jgi:hypothetical protein
MDYNQKEKKLKPEGDSPLMEFIRLNLQYPKLFKKRHDTLDFSEFSQEMKNSAINTYSSLSQLGDISQSPLIEELYQKQILPYSDIMASEKLMTEHIYRFLKEEQKDYSKFLFSNLNNLQALCRAKEYKILTKMSFVSMLASRLGFLYLCLKEKLLPEPEIKKYLSDLYPYLEQSPSLYEIGLIAKEEAEEYCNDGYDKAPLAYIVYTLYNGSPISTWEEIVGRLKEFKGNTKELNKLLEPYWQESQLFSLTYPRISGVRSSIEGTLIAYNSIKRKLKLSQPDFPLSYGDMVYNSNYEEQDFDIKVATVSSNPVEVINISVYGFREHSY